MKAAHVWHCSLTLAPGEKLTDTEWSHVGQRFVHAMKFDSCEWALIKHGATGRERLDHAHLVLNLVQTETGKPARVHNDFKRAQAACAKIALHYGLIELAGQQRHLPKTDRRQVAPRRLTQGIRYEIADHASSSNSTETSTMTTNSRPPASNTSPPDAAARLRYSSAAISRSLSATCRPVSTRTRQRSNSIASRPTASPMTSLTRRDPSGSPSHPPSPNPKPVGTTATIMASAAKRSCRSLRESWGMFCLLMSQRSATWCV